MSSSALTCYTVGLNFVTSSNQYFTCGGGNSTSSSSGAQACCYGGDYCMEDGICHYTHEVSGGSGYYMAGCTDPTWQDPACPKSCTSEYGADVIYNNATQSWNCCVSTSDSLDCQHPSNFTVQAPAPAVLSTIKQANTAVPSATITPIGAITSANATTTMIANLTRSAVNMTVTSTTSLKATLSAHSSSSDITAALSTAPSPPAQASTTTSSAPSSSSSSAAAAASANPVRLLMVGLTGMALFGGQAIIL